jgi:hypothetical protein
MKKRVVRNGLNGARARLKRTDKLTFHQGSDEESLFENCEFSIDDAF